MLSRNSRVRRGREACKLPDSVHVISSLAPVADFEVRIAFIRDASLLLEVIGTKLFTYRNVRRILVVIFGSPNSRWELMV